VAEVKGRVAMMWRFKFWKQDHMRSGPKLLLDIAKTCQLGDKTQFLVPDVPELWFVD
jgi:hypothetical protein